MLRNRRASPTMVSVRGAARFTLAAVAVVAAVVVPAFPAAADPGDWAVSPTMLTFVPTPVGAISTVDVFVTNVGTLTLTPDVSGGAPLDESNFAGTQTCQGRVFAPGEQCVFTFEFRPQSAGEWSTAATVAVDGATFLVQMSGVAPASPATAGEPAGSAGSAPGATSPAGASSAPTPSGRSAVSPTATGLVQPASISTVAPGAVPASGRSRQAAAVVLIAAVALAVGAAGALLALAQRRGRTAPAGVSPPPPSARGRHRVRTADPGHEV